MMLGLFLDPNDPTASCIRLPPYGLDDTAESLP
jgi:hypothetical protein